MALPSLAGHQEVRRLLGRAARAGSLPQSVLIHGPRGIGKERLGLWLAQLLVCDLDGEEPCGECASCRLVPRLEHPDVHWFFPLPRPEGANTPEKLREKLEESRAEELQQWRADPFHIPAFDRAPAHFLAAIRTLQQLASLRPAFGRRKVFVLGDAELMVPQESSPEAANAFLKLLEEPPPETTVVLTSSQPGALLPTIRSRVLSIRAGLLGTTEVRDLLTDAGLLPHDAAGRVADRARGSVRRAIRLTTTQADEGRIDPERKAGRDMLLAALSDGPMARLALAHSLRPSGARAELVGQLESLAEWLRDLLAVLAGSAEQVSDPDAMPILERMVGQRLIPSEGVMRSLDRVAEARDLALGNVNPQLIVATLLAEIQLDLQPATASMESR